MSQCEICLIGKIHKIPQPRGARNIRQLVSIERTRHSQKPGEVRDRISEMFPKQNKLEMFARKKYKGWDAWGNEVKSQINIFKKQAKQQKIAATKRSRKK
jgi:N6-adenosine-specific RNA methylase IME4